MNKLILLAGTALLASAGPALAPLLAQLAARLVELGAADAAVAVEVEPLEHPAGVLGAALLARLARFFRRRPAVMVEVEPREALVDARDYLLAGDIGIAVGTRAGRRLGERGAGQSEQRGAGEEDELVHGVWASGWG